MFRFNEYKIVKIFNICNSRIQNAELLCFLEFSPILVILNIYMYVDINLFWHLWVLDLLFTTPLTLVILAFLHLNVH